MTRRALPDLRWPWVGANLLRFAVLVVVACTVALLAAALFSVAVAAILGLGVVVVGAQFAWRDAARDDVDEDGG